MSIFSSIKDTIFGHAAQAAPAQDANAAVAAVTASLDQALNSAPMSEVDIEATLAALPRAGELNWKVSVADLMTLLGIDASYANRKSLAHELGDADYSGTAEENIWLYKQTMKQLAANGGKVPASMLD
ncbi:MAG: DUF3597 domain-containing protein [Novosphingobium sp.]